ncbi:DUF397 domain-containing protein [Planomonospora venezuelensis]|uniref:DUF397 domain-containing protein n=1 Tax=Planomonospora venezuelensis TaxID=1999 RepID=A0A841D3A5_PLAVE|nr:hypothetical protein [Planomonospora venezuelensis]GIN00076.1 hypothetical protein Pve01_17340 [Planomonospora venezuelensis]
MINRAELAQAAWKKSAQSDQQGGCVSVANLGTHCAIRDSKNPGRWFLVSLPSWRAFVAGVKRGEFAPEGSRETSREG